MTLTGSARTLTVSDLDGTLLDSTETFSAESRERLGGMLRTGAAFTIASARSPLSIRKVLGDLPITLPVVAYNGATAVDADGEHLWWQHFDPRVLQPLVSAVLAAGVTPLVFWLEDGTERISWVRGAETAGVDGFVESRAGDPRLKPVDGWDEVDHERGFFVSAVGEYAVLRRLARMIRAISWGLGCAVALQRGDDGGLAVLDVTAAAATKGAGIRRIAEEHGFDRLVAFGDGVNDLPLFAEADESYAVGAAPEEVRSAATSVLDLPAGDAVVAYLAEQAASRTEV